MSIQRQTIRIIGAVLMLALIIWSYWWLMVIVAIICLFIFPNYFEIIFWGVMYDALYGISQPQFWGFPYVFTVGSIVLFIVAHVLRKLLLAYEPQI